MLRQPLRTAAATFQIGCGLIAVLLCGVTPAYLFDSLKLDAARGLLVGVVVVLGLGLFAVWMAARTQRRWLLVLIVATAVLGTLMIVATARLYAPASVNEQLGLWASVPAACDAVLWVLIMLAAILELRLLPKPEDPGAPGWTLLPAIAAPLALLTALVIMVVTAGPGWLIRLNGQVGDVAPVAQGEGSGLSGDSRWILDLDSSKPALATKAGLAIPVSRDQNHSAGVIMIDPSTGQTRWRYQLHGADGAPDLESTDGGQDIVVSFDGTELANDIPERTYVLAADSGKMQGVWPAVGEVMGTDPPVLFDHVAQDTNSVIAISPTGRKLWTYQPERCADPRSVSSTPSIMLVRARQCDKRYDDLQILGLDAKTGKQRWVQPTEEGGGESGSSQILVRPGFQLELDSGRLARRNLDTGAIAWTSSPANNCSERFLQGSAEVAYVGECASHRREEPTEIGGYAMKTGKRAWQQTLHEPISALAAVDDHRVLALTTGAKTCTLRLVRESGSTTLLKLPGGRGVSSQNAGSLRCQDAALVRVGNSFVLQVRILSDSPSGAERYRFFGLN